MLDRAKFLIISEVSEVMRETAESIESRVGKALERSFTTRSRAVARAKAAKATPATRSGAPNGQPARRKPDSFAVSPLGQAKAWAAEPSARGYRTRPESALPVQAFSSCDCPPSSPPSARSPPTWASRCMWR